MDDKLPLKYEESHSTTASCSTIPNVDIPKQVMEGMVCVSILS